MKFLMYPFVWKLITTSVKLGKGDYFFVEIANVVTSLNLNITGT